MDYYFNKDLKKKMFEERLKFSSIMKLYTKKKSIWNWSQNHSNYGGKFPQYPLNYMKEEGLLPYRFEYSVKPNLYWPQGHYNWNNNKNAGLKQKFQNIGDIQFKDSFGLKKNIPVTDYVQ